MLIGILAVIWIAVIATIVIGRLRDRSTDRSIDSFHERMARMGNPAPLIEPAHRLMQSDEAPPRDLFEDEMNPPTLAPQLRIVRPDTTAGELEREMSWDQWSAAYADDPRERSQITARLQHEANPRAAAYSHAPRTVTTPAAPASSFGTRTQRLRRRNVLIGLVGVVAMFSLGAVVMNSIVIEALAGISWLSLLGFLGLMYYAVTNGLIASNARPVTQRGAHVRREEYATPVARHEAPAINDAYAAMSRPAARRAATSELAEDWDDRAGARTQFVRRSAPSNLYEEADDTYYAQAL
jgi:hypothetical protein